jgi:hypothetical protein
LGLSGWEEFVLPFSQGEIVTGLSHTDIRNKSKLYSTSEDELWKHNNESMHVTSCGILTTQIADTDLDINTISNHTLLVMPRQDSGRSAFGQTVLFKEGRVFSRILPNAEK